jgi:2Fe-2S ferredoxin
VTTVNFVLRDGTVRSVDANDGESVMRAAVRHNVRGIDGECGGEMTCATCHVHIGSPWSERLRRPSHDELDLLDMSDDLTEESRLGCQVHITAELDGLTAVIVTEE